MSRQDLQKILWTDLKKKSDNTEKIVAVSSNMNYFLKSFTLFEFIERIYNWLPSVIFDVQTFSVWTIRRFIVISMSFVHIIKDGHVPFIGNIYFWSE